MDKDRWFKNSNIVQHAAILLLFLKKFWEVSSIMRLYLYRRTITLLTSAQNVWLMGSLWACLYCKMLVSFEKAQGWRYFVAKVLFYFPLMHIGLEYKCMGTKKGSGLTSIPLPLSNDKKRASYMVSVGRVMWIWFPWFMKHRVFSDKNFAMQWVCTSKDFIFERLTLLEDGGRQNQKSQ